MSSEETSQVQVQPVDKEKVKRIWKVAGYLALITIAEFIIAFTVGAGPARTAIFIIMTIAKAFYIVGEFMHLKHEAKVLIWSILIPMLFVVWMLVAFIYEGGSLYDARF